jgi:hypothetical protein
MITDYIFFTIFVLVMTKEEELDTEGLRILRWSMFDSPDSKGSGYMFMEREPVIALDRAAHYHRYRPDIVLGYTSKPVADKMRLVSDNPHRLGRAVRIRCVGPKKRLKLIRSLMEQGVQRFAVSEDIVYFDTDDLKPPSFYLWT